MATAQKSNKGATGARPNIKVIPGSVWGDLKSVKFSPEECRRINRDYRKSGEVWYENPRIEKLRELGGVFVNDIFLKIWENDAQLLFLEGSYGSSKTTYAITRLLVSCMEDKVFKCFYGRQQKEMARQLHSNIIREIERNHWEHLFDYSKKPNGSKSIFCLDNGNCFELFGCDDEDTLKGIDNPTHILVDEVNQIDFGAFGMLVTRLRTSGAKLQFIGCFNPCDVLPSHWIVKYIYAGGKTAEGFVKIDTGGNFSEEELAVLDALQDLSVLSHHSVYTDNYFQNPDAYFKKLVIKAGGDSERVRDYAEGRWGAQLNAQPYYKNFSYQRDVYEYDESLIFGKDEDGNPVGENGRSILIYDRYAPLIFSFDENTQPYLPALIAQRHGDEIWFIDEITAENPFNNIWDVCDIVKERYPHGVHKAGMKIRGDATAKKDSTILEEGQNFFTMIQGLLREYKPDLDVPDSNPNNKMRGLFINIVLKLNYGGLTIKISRKCKKLIEDLENCMEAMDANGVRTGKKDKSTKMVNGVKNVQPYGHLGDCMDYLICGEFYDIYTLFQNNGVTYDPVGGKREVRNSLDNFSRALKDKKYDSHEHESNRQKYKTPVSERIKTLEDYADQLELGNASLFNGKDDTEDSSYIRQYGRGASNTMGRDEDDEKENDNFYSTKRRSRNRMI